MIANRIRKEQYGVYCVMLDKPRRGETETDGRTDGELRRRLRQRTDGPTAAAAAAAANTTACAAFPKQTKWSPGRPRRRPFSSSPSAPPRQTDGSALGGDGRRGKLKGGYHTTIWRTDRRQTDGGTWRRTGGGTERCNERPPHEANVPEKR